MKAKSSSSQPSNSCPHTRSPQSPSTGQGRCGWLLVKARASQRFMSSIEDSASLGSFLISNHNYHQCARTPPHSSSPRWTTHQVSLHRGTLCSCLPAEDRWRPSPKPRGHSEALLLWNQHRAFSLRKEDAWILVHKAFKIMSSKSESITFQLCNLKQSTEISWASFFFTR